MTPGQLYVFEMRAHVTPGGFGPWSNPSGSVTMAIFPNPPTAVVATQNAAAQVKATFTNQPAGAATSATALLIYDHTNTLLSTLYYGSGVPGVSTYQGTTFTSPLYYKNSSILDSGTFYFGIQQWNGGWGGIAESASVTFTGSSATPSAPSLTAVAGYQQVNLSWLVPDQGGSAITDYSLVYSTSATIYGPDILPASSTAYTVPSLSSGVTYNFTLAAENTFGLGPYSNSASAVPLAKPVGQPAAPSITAVLAGNACASVTVHAPTDTGGSALAYYTAISTPGSISASATAVGAASANAIVIVSGLTNGTSYKFNATVTNTGGSTSALSTTSGSVLPSAPLSAPGPIYPSLTALSSTSLQLSWKQPPTGGSCTTWVGTLNKVTGNVFIASFTALAPTVSHTFSSGLFANTNYSASVTGSNSIGSSFASVTATTLPSVNFSGAYSTWYPIDQHVFGVNAEEWRTTTPRTSYGKAGYDNQAQGLNLGYLRVSGGTGANYFNWNSGQFEITVSSGGTTVVTAGQPATAFHLHDTAITGNPQTTNVTAGWLDACIYFGCEPMFCMDVVTDCSGGSFDGGPAYLNSAQNVNILVGTTATDTNGLLGAATSYMRTQPGFGSWTPKYVELGNEIYLGSDTGDGTGKRINDPTIGHYIPFARALATRIKSLYPNCKVALTGLDTANKGINPNWLASCTAEVNAHPTLYDAITLHGQYPTITTANTDANFVSIVSQFVTQCNNSLVAHDLPAISAVGANVWLTEWNFFNNTAPACGSWTHGMAMVLDALTQINGAGTQPGVVSMTGPHAINGPGTSDGWHAIQSAGNTWYYSCWGAAWSLLCSTMTGMSGASITALSFTDVNSNPPPFLDSPTDALPSVQGFAFSNGSSSTAILINASGTAMTVGLPSDVFGTGLTTNSLSKSTPSFVATSTSQMPAPTTTTGVNGAKVTLPGFSITVVSGAA
jgi:hypothetical protein